MVVPYPSGLIIGLGTLRSLIFGPLNRGEENLLISSSIRSSSDGLVEKHHRAGSNV